MEMKPIEIIEEINHESFEYFSNLIKNKKNINYIFDDMYNILIQSKTNKDVLNYRMSKINLFEDEILILEFSKILDYLNTKYDIIDMWFMYYSPKSHLKGFHSDGDKKRYGIAFNNNPKFYSYEFNTHKNLNLNEEVISKKFIDNLNDIEKFNDYFLSQDECNIHNFKKNTIYSFGNTHHTFYNNSDEIRWNLIFDINE
jgi:hypothetical protein